MADDSGGVKAGAEPEVCVVVVAAVAGAVETGRPDLSSHRKRDST